MYQQHERFLQLDAVPLKPSCGLALPTSLAVPMLLISQGVGRLGARWVDAQFAACMTEGPADALRQVEPSSMNALSLP